MRTDETSILGRWAKVRQYRAIVIEYHPGKAVLLLKNRAHHSRVAA